MRTGSTPSHHSPEVGKARKDQLEMGEQRCTGRWGTPVGLQLHELLLLLLLWVASMAFCIDQFVIPSLAAVWEHRLSHYACLKKSQCARVISKRELLWLPGAAPFPGTCLQPCCSGTLWGHLPPVPDLNMACGPVILSQLCSSTAL